MKKRKVLIVDDEYEVIEELISKLKDNQFDIISARNGDEAIVLALKENPDLILLDIVMPGIDGWDTALKLKEIDTTKEIPIIMLTGLSSDSSRKLAKNFCGAVDFLNKKSELNQLLEKVKMVLEGKTDTFTDSAN